MNSISPKWSQGGMFEVIVADEEESSAQSHSLSLLYLPALDIPSVPFPMRHCVSKVDAWTL